MSERMRLSAEQAQGNESPKGGGVGAWLRTTLGSMLSGQKTAEKAPAWSMELRGNVDRSRTIAVRITRIPGDRGFTIACSDGFVGKTVLFDSVEQADHIEQTLPMLAPEVLGTLAGEMGFTNTDDLRINHPEGAGYYMREAIVKACKATAN